MNRMIREYHPFNFFTRNRVHTTFILRKKPAYLYERQKFEDERQTGRAARRIVQKAVYARRK